MDIDLFDNAFVRVSPLRRNSWILRNPVRSWSGPGILIACALGLLAACGGDGGSAPAAPSSPPPPTPAPLPVPPPSAPSPGSDDVHFLLDDVSEIAAPGVPGRLCVYGPDAFPVVVGSFHDAPTVSAPVVAASRWESGRVVVFGHDGYFRRATLATGGTGRLMANAFSWVVGESGQPNPRIGIAGAPELRAWLGSNGFTAVDTTLTPQALATLDVVAVVMWDQSEREVEALRAFVRGGGGLVASATPWAWDYLNPYRNLVVGYAGNRLLEPVGIQWAYGLLVPTSRNGFSAAGPPPAVTHAREALAVVADYSGPMPSFASQGPQDARRDVARVLELMRQRGRGRDQGRSR